MHQQIVIMIDLPQYKLHVNGFKSSGNMLKVIFIPIIKCGRVEYFVALITSSVDTILKWDK